jgi:hypothetical protein
LPSAKTQEEQEEGQGGGGRCPIAGFERTSQCEHQLIMRINTVTALAVPVNGMALALPSSHRLKVEGLLRQGCCEPTAQVLLFSYTRGHHSRRRRDCSGGLAVASLKETRGLLWRALAGWRWHYSRGRGDCSHVLTAYVQTTSLKGAQGVLWRLL